MQPSTMEKATRPTANVGLEIWWKLLRPHTLTASFAPVAIGSTLALNYAPFHLNLFLIMLIASMLIQAATNMLNEYYDYVRGLDNEYSVGISGTIVRDGITPKAVLRSAQASFMVAFSLGLYLSFASSWWLFLCGLIAVSIGYLYSGGPYPLCATPFGELAAGTCMGLVIILISFFIQTRTISFICVLISLPTSILVGAILMSNNIRDLENDKRHGRKTLAIMMGRKLATQALTAMFITAYIGVILLVIFSMISPWILLALVSIPKALQAIKGFRQNTTHPHELMPAMVSTAQTNTIFGLAVSLGLLLQYLRI
ncbi:MAG: 1,4-dihydroxy-2-naphthoate octaprenyltransferase [Firmicutes bacterium]|nr:1,4-dihydroxy-2-naphthoate octaprenyltransferase [Bacillota bacterium]